MMVKPAIVGKQSLTSIYVKQTQNIHQSTWKQCTALAAIGCLAVHGYIICLLPLNVYSA